MRIRAILTTAVASAALAAGTAVAAGPASAQAVPSCTGNQLYYARTATQGATGHANLLLRWHNVSKTTCSLRGYPGADTLGPNGYVIGRARRTLHGFTGGASSVQTIVLAPGHFASADLEWLNFNPQTGGKCRFGTTIATTAANTTRTVTFRVGVSNCGLQIHPTVAGLSGDS